MKPISLYIVEDELLITMSLKTQLENAGYRILGMSIRCETCLSELELLREQGNEPEIVLMDINIRGTIDGIETAQQIRDRFDCGIIFITGQSSKEVYERSFSIKPLGYLLKPIDLEQTMMIIEIASHQRQLEIENKHYQEQLVGLVEKRTLEKQEMADLYNLLVENSLLGLTIMQDGRIVFINKEAERIFGYRKEEIGEFDFETLLSHIHPDDREAALDRMQRRLNGEEVEQESRLRFIVKDGNTINVLFFVKMVQYGGRPALHQAFFDLSKTGWKDPAGIQSV